MLEVSGVLKLAKTVENRPFQSFAHSGILYSARSAKNERKLSYEYFILRLESNCFQYKICFLVDILSAVDI